MKKRSKIVALLLTLVMITSVLTVAPFTASAYVNHTQAEALAWVQSQSGHRVWNGQCAGFINGYYDYLVGYAASGDAKDYQWNSLPEGWYRTNIPTPGDIVVWGAGAYMGESGHYANATYGHVGIVYAVNGGSMDYYDQNSGEYGETVGIHYGHDVSSASTFIHPDFTANLKSDFYAYIINVNTWLLATNNDNWNITANQETGNANQVWHFERLSNGSYKITSQASGASVTKTLKVTHVLSLKKVKVKRSAKKLVLKATLKKVNGKYLKNNKITFKFNGKKFKAKTNKKGIAKVTIKQKVLKKLKVGKKVKYQATYKKDTVKYSIKVK